MISFIPFLLGQEQVRIRSYGSVLYNQENARTDSNFVKSNSIQARLSKTKVLDLSEEYVIPIVFHVLYTNDADRVTAGQLQSQIDALNRDFSGAAQSDKNFNDPDGLHQKLVSDSRIRFCLAAYDPKGRPTSGVEVRQISTSDSLTNSELRGRHYGLSAWDPKKYLNIWVIPLSDNQAGYAQYPGGKAQTDGIVVNSRMVGEGGTTSPPYHLGKTLTHLAGNYLGLRPLWGNSRCEDDYVADTPIHNAPNVGVPGRGHTSLCDGYPTEMTMNFMDNTDDEQQYLFTEGQIKRMRAILSTPSLRGGLLKTQVQCDRAILPLVPTPYLQTPQSKSSISFSETTVHIWPNPVNDLLSIDINLANNDVDARLVIVNTNGRTMHEFQLSETNLLERKTVDVSNWITGIYYLCLSTSDGKIIKPIIVQ